MRMHWLVLRILGLALLFSCFVLAQGTGSISGIVQDGSGAVIPGVNVTVTNVGTGISSASMTTATGEFHVPSLIPGSYEVRAQVSGFETEIRRGLNLTVGSDLAVTLSLKVGQVTQQTVVTAEAAVVNTSNSAIGSLVDDRTIRDLPLNGRSFDQLIALDSSTPVFASRGRQLTYGEVNLYTVNGANGQSNMFMIDGTEMTGAGSATQLPGGVLGTNLGVDAIQEFQVLTSNYSATYGKKAGGIINIATRSGTNQIHGTAFEFLRNSALDARNFFDGQTLPPLRRSNFGGALGGPIRKDRSFIFGTYEGLRQNLGVSKSVIVPNALAHQGFIPDPAHPGQLLNVGVAAAIAPYFNNYGLFPLPNGRDFGDGSGSLKLGTSTIANLDFFLVRFDQKISDKDFFFVRYNFDQQSQTSPNPISENTLYFANGATRDQTVTVEEKRISATTVQLFRLGFSRGFSHTKSGPYDPSLLPSSLNYLPGAFTVGNIAFSANPNVVAAQGLTPTGSGANAGFFAVNQFDEGYQLFHYVGKHSLQTGVLLERNDANDNGGINNLNGAYTFSNGLQSFLQGKAATFSGALPGSYDPYKSFRRWYFATYLQDDYKVTRNLTLNLGLRYEVLTVPMEKYNRLANFDYTTVNGARILNATPTIGSSTFPGNHRNFAPRFGFAWDPFGNGKTSVRGGFGTFFDQDLHSIHFYNTFYSNAPFVQTFTVVNPPFPNPLAGNVTAPLFSPNTFDHWHTATRMQWSLGIQRQLGSSSVFNIGFVGSHSYHLGRLTNANTVVPTLSNGVIFYPSGQPRLQPALSGLGRLVSTDMNSSYNALTTSFNQRVSHGLRFAASFTWSHTLDGGPGTIASQANGELGYTQNPYDAAAEWGSSPYHLKYNFTTNLTYDIPWHKTGWSRAVFGGWQVGDIFTTHPGTPFTVSAGFNNSRDGDSNNPDRPNLAAGANGVSILGGPNQYFDPTVFVLGPAGFFGNVGRNTLHGPGFADLDLTVHKAFSVTERIKVDFRAEFFNILNHANFDLPSAVLFSSTGARLGSAGHVSSTVNTSRQIQGGLKLIF